MSLTRSITKPLVSPLTRAITQAGGGGGSVSIVNNGVLAPFVTFSRASTGTYFDSAGVMQTAAVNVSRVDYDPATLALRGLLVEEQRTNLCIRSQELDNVTNWSASNASVSANAGTAPDGSTTAEKLVENNGATGNKQITQAFTSSVGQVYSISAFVKAAERNCIQLTFGSASPWGDAIQRAANFNLSSLSVISSTGGVAATVTDVGGGWRRCVVTAPVTTAVSTMFLVLRLVDSSGSTGYTGVTNNGILLWGAQLEVGAFASSYIPTTSAAVTRAIDDPDFTIPAGIVRLEYTYDDNTMASVVVTPGNPYQIPTSQNRVKFLRGHRS